jgi:hypothetical protein
VASDISLVPAATWSPEENGSGAQLHLALAHSSHSPSPSADGAVSITRSARCSLRRAPRVSGDERPGCPLPSSAFASVFPTGPCGQPQSGFGRALNSGTSRPECSRWCPVTSAARPRPPYKGARSGSAPERSPRFSRLPCPIRPLSSPLHIHHAILDSPRRPRRRAPAGARGAVPGRGQLRRHGLPAELQLGGDRRPHPWSRVRPPPPGVRRPGADDGMSARNYTDLRTSLALNLTYARGDTFVMRADHKTVLDPKGPGRNSVRIRSNKTYKHGGPSLLRSGSVAHRHATRCHRVRHPAHAARVLDVACESPPHATAWKALISDCAGGVDND